MEMLTYSNFAKSLNLLSKMKLYITSSVLFLENISVRKKISR